MNRFFLTVAALSAASAVTAWAQPAPGGAEADRQAIIQLRQQELARFGAGNVDNVLAVFTDDVVLMPPNEPAVVGREALRSWTQAFYRQFRVEGVYTSASDLTVAGDWGFERLTFILKLTPAAGGAPTDYVGKGVHIYRRQTDGTWKIAQDIWNFDQPVPAPAR